MNALGGAGQFLSADLIPFIAQTDANMVVARLVTVRLSRQWQEDLEMEVGTATFDIVDVIHSNTLAPGMTIEVPMARVANPQLRAKNHRNQWNNLPLETGSLALLACRTGETRKVCQGLGAIPVNSLDSRRVMAIRRAYAIEYFKGPPEQRSALVAEALPSPEAQLRYYALDLLGRRALLGREDGAALIGRAIESGKAEPDDRFDLGDFLARVYFFEPNRGADPTNVAIATTLAKELVAAADSERRLSWVRLLAGCVLGEFSAKAADDHAIRMALVRAVHSPSPRQMADALSSAAHGQAADDEKAILAELQHVWREAHGH